MAALRLRPDVIGYTVLRDASLLHRPQPADQGATAGRLVDLRRAAPDILPEMIHAEGVDAICWAKASTQCWIY